MSKRREKQDLGIELIPTNIEGTGGENLTHEGELAVDSSDKELKVHLDGETRTVVTEDQVQTLENKDIDADENTLSNVKVSDMKPTNVNSSPTLAGATDNQFPTAQAVKTFIEAEAENLREDVDDLIALSGVPVNSTDLGTFTGNIIPNNSTNKQALQSLEDASESNGSDISSLDGRLTQAENDIGDNANDIIDLQNNKIQKVVGGTTSQSLVKFDGSDSQVASTKLMVEEFGDIQNVRASTGKMSIGMTGDNPVIVYGQQVHGTVAHAQMSDAFHTGTDVTLQAVSASVRLTSSTLVSIGAIQIDEAINGEKLVITNGTPNEIQLINNSSTKDVSLRIITSDNRNIKLKPNASLSLVRSNNQWTIVGGVGSGGAGGSRLNLLEDGSFESGVGEWVATNAVIAQSSLRLPTVNNEFSMRIDSLSNGLVSTTKLTGTQYDGVVGKATMYVKLLDGVAPKLNIKLGSTIVRTVTLANISKWTPIQMGFMFSDENVTIEFEAQGSFTLLVDEVYVGADDQLDTVSKDEALLLALNSNPSFRSSSDWKVEGVDSGDVPCNITYTQQSGGNVLCMAANATLRMYQDISSSELEKVRAEKSLLTYRLKMFNVSNGNITATAYRKVGSNLTILRTKSFSNESNIGSGDTVITFDFNASDVAGINNELRIEFTFVPSVVYPSGIGSITRLLDFRVFSSPMNYSPLLHEVREESGWTEWQPITITGQTTNPTKGTTTTDACRKRRNGTQLEIEFVYVQTAGGNSGSGNYIWSCGGLNLNGENLTADNEGLVSSISVGSGKTNLAVIEVFYSSSNLLHVQDETSTYGSVRGGLQGEVYYRFNASIAIKEWSQSSLSIALQSPDNGKVSEVIFTSQEYAPNNFIPANNKSIGSTSSTADFKGSDYRELYNILWNQAGTVVTAGHTYRISSAKGASAEADWNANKTITIDYSTNESFIRANGGTRPLGSYQGDAVGTSTGAGNVGIWRNNTGDYHDAQGTQAAHISFPGSLNFGNENGGKMFTAVSTETRPKNTSLNAYIRYRDTVITASLLESNIIKDVEQFHTDERKICDRCWKGKALFKKCFSGSTTKTTVHVSGATEVVKSYGEVTSANYSLPIGSESLFYATRRTGGDVVIDSDSSDSFPASACWEYTKD